MGNKITGLCKACNKPQELEEYDLLLDIPKIMEREGLCFNCAYWKHRFRELYGANSIKPSLNYVDSTMPTIRFNSDPTIRVVNSNWDMITIHIDKPNPIRFNQGNIFKIKGQYDTYLVNARKVTYQGIIPEHLRKDFIVNVESIDNAEALRLIDLSSTVIKDSSYYIVYD